MKKVFFGIVLLMFAMHSVMYSQGGAGSGERIEALRVAFITRQLQLTPQEAEKFWPVFNIYDDEMRKMIRDHRQKGGSELDLEEKILNMHKKYKPDFIKVVSEEKFDKLMSSERLWRELLQKEIQRRKQGIGGGRSPGDFGN